MNKTTRDNALWISDTPCYIEGNDDNNPYRLTLYVADNGAIMLAAEGNGCADDIMLKDICGWSDEEINGQYHEFNLDQLHADADALREAGREDDADWLDWWIDRVGDARWWYVVQAGNSGDLDGDGSWEEKEALDLLYKAHEEWEREDGDPDTEPQIAVLGHAMTDPFCEEVIHYDDINWSPSRRA